MKKTLILLLSLLAAPLLQAAAPATALVAAVNGDAKIRLPKEAAIKPLRLGQRVSRGNTILTGPGANVRLRLPDGSDLLLNQNSEITLGSLIPKRGQRSSLRLIKGFLRWAIDRKKNPGMDYEVYIQTSAVAVKGTDFETGLDENGNVFAKTYSSTGNGVRLGDAAGRLGLTVKAGQAARKNKDGSYEQRPISKEEYRAAAKQAGMPKPKAPKDAPEKAGNYSKAEPEPSLRGAAGRARALELLGASPLAQDKALVQALAGQVDKGTLGVEGLQRLIKQEADNAVSRAKLAALDAAVLESAKGVGDPEALRKARATLQESLGRDEQASAAMAGAIGNDLLKTLQSASERLAKLEDFKQEAREALGDSQALANYVLTGSRLPDEEALAFAKLDPLDAADLGKKDLDALSQVSLDLAVQLATGTDTKQVLQKAYNEIAEAWTKVSAEQTGGSFSDAWDALGAGILGNLEGTLRQQVAEQLAELRQDLGDAARLDQQQRANDLYDGSAFVDRRGYRVQVASTVLRPDAATVQKVTTSRRDEGPDKGTTVFSYKAVFNTALPEDWTGLLDRDLNAPENLSLGSPAFYKVQEQVSVLSPAGCAACITQVYGAPGFLSGAWRQTRAESFAVMGLDRGQRSFDLLGALQAGSDVITVTAAQNADHWSFDYYNQTLGVEIFTARVWLLDRGAALDAGLMGTGLADLRGFGTRFGGLVNELELSSPLFNGSSVDLLLPNPDFLQAF